MNYYGVGTRFGGTECFLDECCDHNFWCMGSPSERMLELYHNLQEGDVLIAKKYHMKKGAAFFAIEATGIVTDTKMPENVPARFQTDSTIYGVSVIWIRRFSQPISFSSKEFTLGGKRSGSIFLEKKEEWKDIFKKLMKYNYAENLAQIMSCGKMADASVSDKEISEEAE